MQTEENYLDTLTPISTYVMKRRKEFIAATLLNETFPPDDWSIVNAILEQTGRSKFNVYYFYPGLFQEAYPEVTQEVICEVAWSGRIALDYICMYDQLLDSSLPVNPAVLFTSYILQREHLLALHSLLPADSNLWEIIKQCEAETIQSLLEERARFERPFDHQFVDNFRRQAIGKAAYARIAIWTLAELANQPHSEKSTGLIRSIDCYNFAYQIIDDLNDWRRDYELRQLSCILVETLFRLGISDHESDYPDTNMVGTVLYSQVAKEYLDLAESSIQEADDLANKYGPCSQWRHFLQEFAENLQRKRNVILEFLGKANRIRRRARSQDETITQEQAIKAAHFFLLESQDKEGCWRDFATAAYESEDWTTAYVSWSLNSVGKLPNEAMQKAISWLQESRFTEGGWGYHRGVVVDADSTAWVLRFFSSLDQNPELDLEGITRVLLKNQHVTKGFSTYLQPDPIRNWMHLDENQDMSGWCMPHLCVTAVAVAALLESNQVDLIQPARQAVDYMIAQQQESGFWYSYWWLGNYYTTCHFLQVLSKLENDDQRYAQAKNKAIRWLLESQEENGGWSYSPGKQKPTPYYTALALQGLLAGGVKSTSIATSVERAIDWLLRSQLVDGSWEASALLLLPTTDTKAPWNITKWPVAIRGTGILRIDHRRIFTTATVLRAFRLISTEYRHR